MSQTLTSLLQRAQRYCDLHQQRLTPNRREVLAILANSHKPMSAYDILDAMRPKHQSVKPPTVYRALKFLLDAHLIHNIDATNQYLVCSHLGQSHQAQLLVCDRCGDVQEVQLSAYIQQQLLQSANEFSFQLVAQPLVLHGICQRCQQLQ